MSLLSPQEQIERKEGKWTERISSNFQNGPYFKQRQDEKRQTNNPFAPGNQLDTGCGNHDRAWIGVYVLGVQRRKEKKEKEKKKVRKDRS